MNKMLCLKAVPPGYNFMNLILSRLFLTETDTREVNFSRWQNYNKISLDWFLNVSHCTLAILPISSRAMQFSAMCSMNHFLRYVTPCAKCLKNENQDTESKEEMTTMTEGLGLTLSFIKLLGPLSFHIICWKENSKLTTSFNPRETVG